MENEEMKIGREMNKNVYTMDEELEHWFRQDCDVDEELQEENALMETKEGEEQGRFNLSCKIATTSVYDMPLKP
ncbi:unnamed protein product [Sphenostylis stenocarpa]|uniref:Uncharacterized protein n=1 Tax=Sphenostylis stenocarpa TaxID=92480 RepID=A0AA86T630_9FABA|nr:unnamed protein product [Sphenostylis stenocarpa]